MKQKYNPTKFFLEIYSLKIVWFESEESFDTTSKRDKKESFDTTRKSDKKNL